MGASRGPVGRKPPRHGVRLLERLVRELGPAETARRAGVAIRTIARWARAGVSLAGREELRRVHARREAARAARAARAPKKHKPGKAAPSREDAARERRERAAKEKRELRERLDREAKAKRERAAEAARAAKVRAAKEAALEADRKRRVARQEEIRKAKEAAKEVERKARHARAMEARRKSLEEARARAEYERQWRAELAQKKKDLAEKARLAAIAAREAKKKAVEESRRAKRTAAEAERDDKLEQLREACRLLETNSRIAEVLGVNESTVRRWLKNPPIRSKSFDQLIKMLVDVHTLLALMKASGETEALPKIQSGSGRRSGKKTDGVWWTKLVMRHLTPRVIREIAHWVRTRPGRFYPCWQVVLTTSQFAVQSSKFDEIGTKKTGHDYKTVVLQFGHQRWGDFAISRPEPSDESDSRDAAARNITARMLDKLESGLVQIFIHGVTVFAYRRRSKEEMAAWESKRRKEIKERWKRKHQK